MKRVLTLTFCVATLIGTAVFTGCKKKDPEPVTKEYYLRFKIDGEDYVTETDQVNSYDSYGTGDIGWFQYTNLFQGLKSGMYFFDDDIWMDSTDVMNLQGTTLVFGSAAGNPSAHLEWASDSLELYSGKTGSLSVAEVSYMGRISGVPYFKVNGTFECNATSPNDTLTYELKEGEFNFAMRLQDY